MTWFWIFGVALAALAIVLTLRPLLFTPREKKLSRSESNIAIYRDQLAELDADLSLIHI